MNVKIYLDFTPLFPPCIGGIKGGDIQYFVDTVKKYQFKLETLLKYRRLSEDKLRQELLLKIQKLRECESQLSLMKSEKQRTAEEFTHVQLDGINGASLSLYKNYLNNLIEQVEKQEVKTMNSKKETEEMRKEYLEARKKLESVEKLKEKDFQRYLKKMRVSEQKVLDEVATNQYNAKNGN